MDKNELKDLLARLHQVLRETDELDPELENLVQEVDDDLHRLANEEDHSPRHDLGERIERAATNFEANHPRTGSLLREVADLLGKMGI